MRYSVSVSKKNGERVLCVDYEFTDRDLLCGSDYKTKIVKHLRQSMKRNDRFLDKVNSIKKNGTLSPREKWRSRKCKPRGSRHSLRVILFIPVV